ncbi:MAG: carbohydrate-binding protein [Anaerolinea sp.]|nr:carbohydrate-binding protein [Anaerolinea sp.]
MNFTKHHSLSTLCKLSIVILMLLFATGGSPQKAEAAKGHVQIRVTSTYPLERVWVVGFNQYGQLKTWTFAPNGARTAATTNWWWKSPVLVRIQYRNNHVQQQVSNWTSTSLDWHTASFTYYGTNADNPKPPAISSPLPGSVNDRTIRFQILPASPNYTGKRDYSVGVEQIGGNWRWTSGWTSSTGWNILVPSDGHYRLWAQQGDTVNRASPIVTTVIAVKRDIGQPRLTAPKDATSRVEVTIIPGSLNYTGKADWLVQCYSNSNNPDGSIVGQVGWTVNPKPQIEVKYVGDVMCRVRQGDTVNNSSTWSNPVRILMLYDRAKAIAFAAAKPGSDYYGGNYNDGNNYGYPSAPPSEKDIRNVGRECAAYVARTLKAGGIPVENADAIKGNDQVFGYLSNNNHTYPFGSRSIEDLAARIGENQYVEAVKVVVDSSYNTSKLRPGDVVFFGVVLTYSEREIFGIKIRTNYRWGAEHAAIITDGKYNNEPLLAYWHPENYQIFQTVSLRGQPITLENLFNALGADNFLVVRFRGDEIAWKQISVPTMTPPPSVTPKWTIVPSATSTWIPTQTPKPSSTFTATPSVTSSRTPSPTSTSILIPTATANFIGFDAFARNEAATFIGKNGPAGIVPCIEGGQNVSGLADGSNFYFSNMNFGSGAKAMQMRLAAANGANAEIDIWVDYPGDGGTLLATVPIPNTGGTQAWRTIALNVQPVSGVHALYFRFRGTWNPNDVGIKWFQFFAESAPTPIYTATSTATPTKTYTPTPPPTFTATKTPIPVKRFRGQMYFTQTISNIDTAYGYIEHFNFYLDRTYDILLDLGKNSGTLQYDLILADASGNTIQLAKSSVNGRGILFRQLGAGWYNVFVISKVGSNAVFNLTIYQGFGWLCPNCVQEAYTDMGLWQWTPNAGIVHSFEIQAIDGTFNFNVTVYNAAGTLYTGSSVNGYLKFNLTMGNGQHWMRLNFTGGAGSYTATRR